MGVRNPKSTVHHPENFHPKNVNILEFFAPSPLRSKADDELRLEVILKLVRLERLASYREFLSLRSEEIQPHFSGEFPRLTRFPEPELPMGFG